MPTYRVEKASSGAKLLTLVAESEQAALDAVARYAGYLDFAEAASEGNFTQRINVRLTQVPERSASGWRGEMMRPV